jgi:hypothetical protein
MKTGNIKLILTAVTIPLFVLLLLIGCNPESNAKSHWFVDENGYFHTDNVTLAQKKIPFTIVVPTYIPDVFVTNYQYEIIGPFKNILPNNIEVEIQYWDDKHQIYISEYNVKEVVLPNEELKPIYYEIAGIRVLRQTTGLTSSSGRIEGLSFDWNMDGLTFEVKIFNIPEEEGRKIVESMIKQLK